MLKRKTEEHPVCLYSSDDYCCKYRHFCSISTNFDPLAGDGSKALIYYGG